MRKLGLFVLLVGNVVWFAACGGNGGGSNSVTSVSVSCSPSTVASGGTSQCSALVGGTGNFSTGVTWSTSAGTISSSGLLSAPTVTSTTTVTVTATSTQNTSVSGIASVTVTTNVSTNNVAPIIVDAGPAGSGGEANIAYISISVCVPGTNTCQTIDHVQVDTGSEGLRLLSGASGGELSIPLPQATISGSPLDECLVFADGFVWGPVVTANVTILGAGGAAGESASNIPVQMMIPASSSPAVPSSCSSQSTGGNNEGGSLMAFGANGLIGVGPFQQDCGLACTNLNSQIPDFYYACPSGGCNPTYVPLAQQVPNPVSVFATDNNGVLIQLPAVPNGGSSNVPGSLIFGIGTEANNALPSSANVYQLPGSSCNCNSEGDFITTFNGHSYPNSFIDSGSNGLYFLDSSTTGIATCTGSMNSSGYYCPSNSPDNLTASNQGQNSSGPVGSSIPVNFTIENALTLFNTGNTAYSTLGGPMPGIFDWGLPFFYGKPNGVFTAIDGDSVPGTNIPGPFFAY